MLLRNDTLYGVSASSRCESSSLNCIYSSEMKRSRSLGERFRRGTRDFPSHTSSSSCRERIFRARIEKPGITVARVFATGCSLAGFLSPARLIRLDSRVFFSRASSPSSPPESSHRATIHRFCLAREGEREIDDVGLEMHGIRRK